MGGIMIIRVEKTKDYTTIHNQAAHRKDISARAKGLFWYLMTLPDDWQIYKQEVYTHFTEGRKAIDKAFDELKNAGYMVMNKIKDDKGRFKGWEYILYEKISITEKQFSDKSGNGKSENRPVGKGPILNTNTLNTNNTKYSQVEMDIIDYLNKKTSKGYKYSKTSLKYIRGRLNEDFTLKDFKTVIDNKTDEWLNDKKMNQYLRPKTLFSQDKFEGYLNQSSCSAINTLQFCPKCGATACIPRSQKETGHTHECMECGTLYDKG